MTESPAARILLRLGALATLAFIYFPLIVIALYALMLLTFWRLL